MLPNTRPDANTFGPDMEDDGPMVEPDLETPASVWNLVREALAFCGQVVPLSVTSFDGSTGFVINARGGVLTCVRLGVGDYRVTTSGGWVIGDANVNAYGVNPAVYVPKPLLILEDATNMRVRTFDAFMFPTDQNFLVVAY